MTDRIITELMTAEGWKEIPFKELKEGNIFKQTDLDNHDTFGNGETCTCISNAYWCKYDNTWKVEIK